MAYHQNLPYETPPRPQYDPRIASYTVPPHTHAQPGSRPSERRIDHTWGFQYENGSQGTIEYGEYNNRPQGYAWADSPTRQNLGQPSSYRLARGEAQVPDDRRHDRRHGPERAYGSHVEVGGHGRGGDRGQSAGPRSDTRPVKSQKYEAAAHVQVHAKPLKQSIIPKPTSPVSTAWDNPFPTFPTARSKHKLTEGGTLSDNSGELKHHHGVKETGSAEGRHQRVSRGKGSPGTARSQEHLQNVVERAPRDHQNHAIQSNADRRWDTEQKAEVDPTKTIPGSAQTSVPSLPSRPVYDDKFGGQSQIHGRREQVSGQSDHVFPGPHLPPSALRTASKPSTSVPGELPAARLDSDVYRGYSGALEWQEPGPTGAYYGPDSHVIIPHRPATSEGDWALKRVVPGPGDATPGYEGRTDRVVKPEPTNGHLREYSLGDFFDSYCIATPKISDTKPADFDRWHPLENEMPNFDVILTESADYSRGLAFEQHPPNQGSDPGFVTAHSSAFDSVEMHGESYPAKRAHRSIFQLDHGGPSQSRSDNGAGFVFELVGDAPAVPQAVSSRTHDRAQPLYEQKGNVMSYRQYNDQPAQPKKPGIRLGMDASLAAGGFDDRSQDEWQRHARDQQVSYLPGQLETPAARAHSGARAGPSYSLRSPETAVAPSAAQFDGCIGFRDVDPSTSALAVTKLASSAKPTKPNAPSVSTSQHDQPISGRPPFSNPDALPEHPTPVRQGLVQGVIGSQAPKPPPIRQYDNSPSPVQQSNHTLHKIPSRARQEKGSLAPVTLEELEKFRQVIKANPKDQKTQLVLAKKLVEAASVLAGEGGRADPKLRSKNREKYIFDAHKIVKKLASGGNADAMFYLADCHGRGLLGLENDDKEAFTLYQSAAKAGHAQSAYRVAVCCEMGQEGGGGTRRDPLKAMQWYKRAAMLGDTPAMYKMGMILLKGLLGQPRNSREAIVWLKRAADRADEENPHALHELGLLYENASGNDHIVRDERYSKQLFTQAAELGYKFSQFRLGCAYEYGLMGCAIEPRQSIAWYSRAAIQGEHQSELALSGWYLTGSEGVLQQSDTEAYLWARKAAHAGLAKAEYAMGYFTEVGIGAPANIEDAKRWYWRAASQSFPKARERLEDLRKGGAKMQKSRVSRSAVNKQSEGDCIVM